MRQVGNVVRELWEIVKYCLWVVGWFIVLIIVAQTFGYGPDARPWLHDLIEENMAFYMLVLPVLMACVLRFPR
jgi:hypothetical protein